MINIKKFFKDEYIKFFFKSGVVIFMSKIFSTILSFGIIYLISHYIGADYVGIISLLNTIINIFLLISIFGLETVILKLFPKYEINNSLYFFYKKIIILVFFLILITSILVFLSFPYITNNLFKKTQLIDFLWVIIFFLAFKTLWNINMTFLRSLKKYVLFALMQSVPNLLILLAILFCLFLISKFHIEFNKNFVIYLYFLTPSFFLIILFYLIIKNIYKFNSKKYISYKKIIKISLPMVFASSFSLISSQTDIFMLGMFENNQNIGFYSVDVKLVSLIILINISMNSMIVPKISEAYHNNNLFLLKTIAQKSTIIISITSIPIAFILIFFGKDILSYFGRGFESSYNSLLFLTIAQVINSLSGPNGHFLNMTGYHKYVMIFVAVSSLINIILNFLLIKNYGIVGAAIATMISIITWNLLANFFIFIKFRFFIFLNPLIFIKKEKNEKT